VYLIWGDAQDGIFRGVRSEQNGVRLAYAGKDQCQADGKQDGVE